MKRAVAFAKPILIRGMRFIYGDEVKPRRIPWGPIAGHYLYANPSTSLRMFMGIDEPEVARMARRLLRNGDVVYDLGAHIGYTMVLFATLVGPQGRVEAFELLPSTADLLRRTRELNSLGQCQIHAVGVGEREELLSVEVGDTLMGTLGYSPEFKPTGRREDCRVVRLDDYRRQHDLAAPTLVKIDIEGAEIKALVGAEATILEAKPLMIIEFHHLDLLREGFTWLEKRGYRIEDLSGKPLTAADVVALRSFYGSLFCYRPDTDWHRKRTGRPS